MFAKLRSLSSDTLIYGVSTVVGRLLTFLLTPLYTNYVTPSELGDTAYLYSLIAFVNVVYSCGFDSAFFKFFRTSDDDETLSATHPAPSHNTPTHHNRSVFAHTQMAIVIVAGSVSLLLMFFSGRFSSALGLSVQGERGASLIVYAVLIALFDALVLIPFAALRMERRSRRFALTKFAVIVCNILANLVLVVWLGEGIRGIFLAGVLSSLAGVVLLLPEFSRYLLGGPIVLDSALLRELWKFGIPTVPAAFSTMMLQVVDRPILKLFTDSSSLGIYQANYRLGIPMMMMVTVFEYAWKPFYLRETSQAAQKTIKTRRATHILLARVLSYFTVLCGIIFLATSLFMEFIVRVPFVGGRFVNPLYWNGMGIIPIVLGAYYWNGMFSHFAASAYIRKRTKYLPQVSGVAALLNIVLNFSLIPFFGIWGAAWATFGAYMVSAGGMYCITRRIYPLQYEWRRVGISIVSAVLLYGCALYTTRDLSLQASFLIRCAYLAAYPILLLALGVFNFEDNAVRKRIASPQRQA